MQRKVKMIFLLTCSVDIIMLFANDLQIKR